ncbi:MAG: ComEC/Rec2 family competence protein [Clostridia bacterium]|nr:ComEC/Rec2 family competence protein [Clostridia bacterium]
MLHRRYLAGILAAYTAVFASAFYLELSLLWHCVLTAGVALLLFISIFFVSRRFSFEKVRVGFGVVAAILLTVSLVVSELFLAGMARVRSFADEASHLVSASVSEVRYEQTYHSLYVLEIYEIDGQEDSFRALWEIPENGALSVGNEIRFEGVFTRIEGEYASYSLSQGILLQCESETFEIVNASVREPDLFARIRFAIASLFHEKIGGAPAGYATALLTGDRSGLDAQTTLSYQRLGLSHLIAISGLHFSILVGGLGWMLRLFGVTGRVKNILLLVSVILFALICGFSGSVARAAIMLGLYFLMAILEEQHDSVTALMLSAAAIVTASPYSVYDAGLWLSVFSVLGILLVAPPISERMIGVRSVWKRLLFSTLMTLLITVTATFFTLPITYFLYGGISLISPLTNLIFIPISQVVLYLLAVLVVLGWIPYVSDLLGILSRLLIDGMNEWIDAFADIKGVYFIVRYPFADYLLPLLILGVAAVLLIGRARLGRILACFASCTAAFLICLAVYAGQNHGVSELHLLTDGKSDVLLIVDDGETMLADVTTGGRSIPMAALDALAEHYQGEIDVYLLTHLHRNHAATLRKLTDRVKVHELLIPEPQTQDEQTYVHAIREALAGNCRISFYRRDGTETVTLGDTTVTLPAYERLARSTHPVILFSGTRTDGERWVYCGASAMDLFDTWDTVLGCDTLIFGSHGPAEKYIVNDECLAKTERIILTRSELMEFIPTEYVEAVLIDANGDYTVRLDGKAP